MKIPREIKNIIRLEKEEKLHEAIDLYLKSIEFGEQSNRLNINNYAHDIERVVVLFGKTKQKDKLIEFLKRIISAYPDYSDVKKWAVRLSKFNVDSNSKEITIKKSDIKKQIADNPTLGKKLNDFKASLPEFNFYYDMPEGMQTFEYINIKHPLPFEKSKQLREYKDAFNIILSKAKIAENENDLKTAIEVYENLVVEEYEVKEPYERLMILYKKLKWKDDESRIIKHSISFFSKLKEKQRENILSIAKKYGMEEKALEYINADKKIFHYGGAFELYNPFPVIKKWEKRLKKIGL